MTGSDSHYPLQTISFHFLNIWDLGALGDFLCKCNGFFPKSEIYLRSNFSNALFRLQTNLLGFQQSSFLRKQDASQDYQFHLVHFSQVDPNFSYAYTLLGHEYVMIEELEKALACYRNAVRIDPRHYNAWYGIGLTYYKQERFSLADG